MTLRISITNKIVNIHDSLSIHKITENNEGFLGFVHMNFLMWIIVRGERHLSNPYLIYLNG